MNLPIPIFRNDKIYTTVDIQKPRTGIITKAYDAAVYKGLNFKAMLEFVSGCIEAIHSLGGESESDATKIKRICGMMASVSAEAVALKVMGLINEDDYIEGVYICPRCGEKIITGDDGITDTRDKVSDLDIINMEEEFENSIFVQLSEPVKIKEQRTGEILESIENFEVRYPTLNDCMNAEEGQKNEMVIALRIYCNAIQKVNGLETTRQWKGIYGMLVMNKVYPKDLSIISRALSKYGIQKTKQRLCKECGKTWEAPLNTSNFFVSGLQPV